LQELELIEPQRAVADAVRRDLQQVLEEGDAPTDQRGDEPRLAAQVAQMRVPGEGHEDVRKDQQENGEGDTLHGASGGRGRESAAASSVTILKLVAGVASESGGTLNHLEQEHAESECTWADV